MYCVLGTPLDKNGFVPLLLPIIVVQWYVRMLSYSFKST